jgi:hypothetical protein
MKMNVVKGLLGNRLDTHFQKITTARMIKHTRIKTRGLGRKLC